MTQEVVYENTTTYTIKAPTEESRTVLIEHPRRGGWDLVGEWADKADKTLTHYRLKLDVKAGESKKLPVTLRNKGKETISLVSIHPNDIAQRLRASGKDISPKVREALEKISAFRQDMAKDEMALNQLRQERNRITQDQNRIRENLRSVSQNSAIGKRYLDSLDKQETQLEGILDQEEKHQNSLNKKREELSTYVNGLNL